MVSPSVRNPSARNPSARNPSAQRGLFRPGALEQNASPDRLDQLIQIVNPKRWLTLVALGTLVSAGAAWSVLGQIPIQAEGRGVLIYPNQVTTLKTDISGRIKTVEIQPNELIEPGDVIATIDQSELRKQLELAENKLSQLFFQNQTADALQQQREGIERTILAQQRQTLQARLLRERSLPEQARRQSLNALETERQSLERQRTTLVNLLPTYEARWEGRAAISLEGALSRDDVLAAEREYQDIKAQIAQLSGQISQIDANAIEVEQTYVRAQSELAELESQLKALDGQSASQTEQDQLTAANRRKELQEAERAVDQLKAQLQETETIVSQHRGQVIELNMQPGQLVDASLPLAVVNQTSETEQKLVSVSFFPVSEGRKVELGDELQVTPATVKREEFGGIVGQVSRISDYQITREGAASLVGNADILADVMGQGSHIAVFAELEQTDQTATGFKWSASRGPNQAIQPGVTTTVQVTLEERSPISFVLPILKSWTGLS